MGKKRMMKHIMAERNVLVDQANMFATGDAHRIETRDGRLQDVTEERLEIMLEQVREIDSIINDPDCRPDT